MLSLAKEPMYMTSKTNHALQSSLANFDNADGELKVADRLITEIAGEAGTPFYLYDRASLHKRYHQLRQALPADLNICYAVKANPNNSIIRELDALYDGLDIASKGEMMRALDAGSTADRMSFAGPGKSADELKFAIENDIGAISVESAREIDHIRQICQDNNKQVNILVRVNPAFELSSSGMKMGGGPKQFGIDSELVPELIKSLVDDRYLRFHGIHIFAGSQNLSAESIADSFDNILRYAQTLRVDTGVPLPIINMGGGFGIPYIAKATPLDLQAVGLHLSRILQSYRTELPETSFKIELGRYIVGECGIYVSRVLYRKVSRGETFLVTDGGLHHHLAASGNLGQKMVHRPMPITVANKLDHPLEHVNLVGPLCTPLDTFGMRMELPTANEGDLIAVFNSGAYGYSASPLGFLSHNHPKEIIL